MKIARSAIMAVGLVRAMGVVFFSFFFFSVSLSAKEECGAVLGSWLCTIL